jgi:hypothetical protein
VVWRHPNRPSFGIFRSLRKTCRILADRDGGRLVPRTLTLEREDDIALVIDVLYLWTPIWLNSVKMPRGNHGNSRA